MSRLPTYVAWLMYALIVLPTAIVVATSFTSTQALVFPPNGFSTRWYTAVLADREMMEGLRLSVGIALANAVGGAIIGTLAALYLSRPGLRGRNALAAAFLSPLSVPTVMMGFALLL